MNPTIIKELLAIATLGIFTFIFYTIPSPMAHLLLFVAVAVMFVVYLISILGRTERDEREEAHRALAAEAGFAVGGCLVLGAIAHQVFVMKEVDVWLFVILFAMLVVRLFVRFVLDQQN